MRADAHYVELMDARATHAPPAQAQALAERPLDITDPTLHAGRDLAQAMATVTSCAALLADASTELSRAVVGDLIRAEAWRAATLLHATRVVRKELSVARTAISVSGVLDTVTTAFQPERRVRGITIDARSTMPYGSVVVGDEPMVAGAMSWALLASLTLVSGLADARLTLSVGSDPSTGVAFTVSQASVTPPAIWQARAFDPTWTDRPGGVPALLWMLALQETAHAHDGTVRVERSDRGTTIGFTVPAGV